MNYDVFSIKHLVLNIVKKKHFKRSIGCYQKHKCIVEAKQLIQFFSLKAVHVRMLVQWRTSFLEMERSSSVFLSTAQQLAYSEVKS